MLDATLRLETPEGVDLALAPAGPVVEEVLAALADDLDAPRAVAAVDRWVDATLGTDGLADTSDPDAAVRLLGLVDAALGLSLWPR